MQKSLESREESWEVAEREARAPLVLGVDVGTSSVRAALFDGRGREVTGTHARATHIFRTTREGGAESDAEHIVTLVETVVDEVLKRTKAQPIQAVAVACFWHSLVGVDEAGHARTPVFGWADTRASLESAELQRRFDAREMHARTGCRFHPSYWPAKLLWLRRQEPEVCRDVARWVSAGEFITRRFSGEWAASVSMASGTGLFNQKTCEWDVELLKGIGLDLRQMPPLVASGWTTTLNEPYARRWPQLRGAQLIPAVGDGAANSIGAGCVERGTIALMVGTSGAMRVMWEGEPPVELPPALWCYRADRCRVIVGGALSDGGGLHGWMTGALALGVNPETLERELSAMEPDAHGLTILPFWFGERSTNWSADARGAILGLTAHTRPLEILRASMEAVAYRLALIADALEVFAPGAEVRASGGALAASPAWAQIIADVLGRPVELSAPRETSSLGAVLLALEALGALSIGSSVAAQNIIKTYMPDHARHARYQDALDRQQTAYHKFQFDR